MEKTEANCERIMEAAENACAHIIESKVGAVFAALQEGPLAGHTLELQDAMGSIGIYVYRDDWNVNACVTRRIAGLEHRGREVPDYLRELDELLSWYCRLADRTNVSVELVVTPQKPDVEIVI